MVKILLLARLTLQSGNLTTAQRIKGHLAETGHECKLQSTESFESSDHFKHYIVENGFCCVIGIHLWRAGKLLLDCPVPFSMIFGGTDLNEHVQDSEKLHVMTQVVEKAKNLVAFSQTMAFKAKEIWPNIKPKLIVQPQAVFTCPSKNFTEIDMICKMKECATANESLHLTNILCGALIIFLVVAGLRPVKDPMFLFKVFSDWHKEDSKVFLVVVGPEIDSEFSKTVKETAMKYPGVIVIPALSQCDLHAAIQHCITAVVNTSLSEGMAACILEAMDLNTVVLARKIPGNESLIKHGENGLLFETPEEFLWLAKQVAYNEKCRDKLTLGGKKLMVVNVESNKKRTLPDLPPPPFKGIRCLFGLMGLGKF